MATVKTEKAEPAKTEVVSSNGIEIVDNTDIVATPEAPVTTEEYELTSGLFQVNYI